MKADEGYEVDTFDSALSNAQVGVHIARNLRPSGDRKEMDHVFLGDPVLNVSMSNFNAKSPPFVIFDNVGKCLLQLEIFFSFDQVGCKGPFDNLCWIAREILENRMIRWKGSFMEAEGRL